MAEKPKFTQRMTTHLNGGSKFSELRYSVFRDGEPTAVRRVTRTNGSPKYLKTQDVFLLGEEVFDVLATKGAGLEEWLTAHAKPEGSQ